MKKIMLSVFLILFSGICLAYGLEDKVVVIVNDEVITKAELDTYISLIKMQIGEDGWKQYGMTERKALENLIENRLIVQEAKNRKIEAEDRQVESKINNMRGRFSSEEEFSDFLRSQGLSLAELQEHIKEQMLTEKLISTQIRNRIFISPSEVTDYYNNHTKDFYFPDRVRVDSIFIGTENLAKEAYNKLRRGADFTAVQEEYSKRGNLGLVAKGQLRKEIEDVIFSLEEGKFSKPVETSEGYFIFLVREKLQPSARQLSEVQQVVYNMIWENKFNAKLKEFIQQLKTKSYISIKDEK
ncbi:MAG: SurA N-terminal domain-containing protein [Candidatus Omnitrophica bacterium]|nr:SurA N-terminal domain-containing protein [Candidatus Omnitrophota bacterium]